MVENNQYRSVLFEILCDENHSRGNAGIVIFPDGHRYLMTARHVVYKGLDPLNVRVQSANGTPFITGSVRFDTFHETDIAILELTKKGEGISVARVTNVERPLKVVGSLFGSLFELQVFLTHIGEHKVESIKDRTYAQLSGNILHYRASDIQHRSFPGSSGSLILDSNNLAVGIQTAMTVERTNGTTVSGHKSMGYILRDIRSRKRI